MSGEFQQSFRSLANSAWSACPADIAEEKSALGVCFWGQAKEATQLLEADDFSLSAHREIFAAICELVSQGEKAIEISLLAAELHRRRTLEAIGGVAYLADLDHGIVLERQMASRLKILREFAKRRRLLTVAQEAICRASDLSRPIAETKAWLLELLR